MSRYYNTSTDKGLSRQSSKTYKVIRRKSNAELNEKLRRLDIEHNTNIAKILNERYNLRTLHFNLMHSGGESSSDSDGESTVELDVRSVPSGDTEDLQSQEKWICSSASDNSKKQTLLQLPSIIEDSSISSKPLSKSPKLGRSPLPPLSEHGFSTRVRKSSESTHFNPSVIRTRQRSSSFPAGQMPGDRQRKNEFRRIAKPTHGDAHGKRVFEDKSKHEKPILSDGKRVGEDKPNQTDDDKPMLRLTVSTSWDSELHGCRYLRHKRYSTPDVDLIDMESIFDKTSEK